MDGRARLWLFVVLLGCQGAGAPSGPAITFGAIFPETGSLGTSGQLDLLGPRLAVDEINAAGGLLGRTLVLLERNDNADPMTGLMVTHELIDQQHVPAIVGPLTSRVMLTVAPIAIAAQVVMITGDATSPEISKIGGRFIFRTVASDIQQGKLLAERAHAHGFARAAVIHEPGPYGTGLGASFADNFAAQGGTVTDNVAYVEGQLSYRDLLGSVYETNPEAILLVGFPTDGAQIVRDYVLAFAYRQTFWFFTDGVQDQSFVTTVGASNFTFRHEATGPGMAAGDAFTRFENAHIAKYGFAPAFSTANNYDAVYLLALAVAQAGRAEGAAISDNLRRVANPPGMIFGPEQFAQAVAAISAGTKINYEGASGSVDLDQNGDPSATYVLWQVSEGKIVITQRGLSP